MSNPESQNTDWTNIIQTMSPAGIDSFSNNITHSSSFNFLGLTPSTNYKVIVQSRNIKGWSDPTPNFRFSTKTEGKNFFIGSVGPFGKKILNQ